MHQLSLPIDEQRRVSGQTYYERLVALLAADLDFHEQNGRYASHNFHAFPAKFPAWLPRTFITELTEPGATVLDPMSGSGTTILEAFLLGRRSIGFDIDPLALRIIQAKVTPLEAREALHLMHGLVKRARSAVETRRTALQERLNRRWDEATRQFVDYWFAQETQIELIALLEEIEAITDAPARAFFELAFSAIIITKSGGVSLALDLAHTRPHRAKRVLDKDGAVRIDETNAAESHRIKNVTKILRSAFDEFEKRALLNIRGLPPADNAQIPPAIQFGNAQALPLDNNVIDLIVTSPPYASNAIDYMRAHKFALVWLGHPIAELSNVRQAYIGGDAISNHEFEALPATPADIVAAITRVDPKKGRVLHRYYSEMSRTLREMLRVLKPGKAAIVVVGSSVMRNIDTNTAECLAAIGRAIGFEVPRIGVRRLDRDRRMMPAGAVRNHESQIQQRMHEEYVIGFYKPEAS